MSSGAGSSGRLNAEQLLMVDAVISKIKESTAIKDFIANDAAEGLIKNERFISQVKEKLMGNTKVASLSAGVCAILFSLFMYFGGWSTLRDRAAKFVADLK